MQILGPTPITPCKVRAEFLYDLQSHKGEYVSGYIFGFRAVLGRVPAFQVMLETGAQWANLPIHALVQQECEELPMDVCSRWDCFSDTFTVVELPLLKNLRCLCIGPDKVKREGNYLFTIDWQGLWAEIPDQHKQHHIIALKTGHIVGYPNNFILWTDPAYYKETEKLEYLRNTRQWSVEGKING